MNSLAKFEKDGIELVIDIYTGEVFASEPQLALICNVSRQSIMKWRTSNQIDLLSGQIPTATGFKTSNLYPEETILKALAKYNPELLLQCAKAGLRIYLHGLAGYRYEVKKEEPVTEPKPLALENALDIAERVTKLKGEIPEAIRQIMFDQLGDRILSSSTKSLPSSPRMIGVSQLAEELGYTVNQSIRVKLGKFIKSAGFQSTKERRLCNGEMREINVYEHTKELEQGIHRFFNENKVVKFARN